MERVPTFYVMYIFAVFVNLKKVISREKIVLLSLLCSLTLSVHVKKKVYYDIRPCALVATEFLYTERVHSTLCIIVDEIPFTVSVLYRACFVLCGS